MHVLQYLRTLVNHHQIKVVVWQIPTQSATHTHVISGTKSARVSILTFNIMLVYISEAAGNYTCLHVYLIGPSIDAPVTVASTTLAPERISFNTF